MPPSTESIWLILKDGTPSTWVWGTTKSHALAKIGGASDGTTALRTELRRIPQQFQTHELTEGATYEPMTRCVCVGGFSLDIDDCGTCVGGAVEPTPPVVTL